MRKLDVSTYGVEEMKQQEIVNVNGGWSGSDVINWIEKAWGYVSSPVESLIFDSCRACIDQTGGLNMGEHEFLYQSIRGI